MRGIVKKIVPDSVRAWLRECRSGYRISRSPDRAVLTDEIIPALLSVVPRDADVLWIGCQRYTTKYYRLLERNGARCWTLEIDPSAAKWGRSGRHTVGDILDLKALFPDRYFDAVLCNGILGWGVDTESAGRKACEAMAAVTKPGGWMLLGWNTDRIPDPLPLVTAPFDHTGLPGVGSRRAVEGCTHIYDLFRRR